MITVFIKIKSHYGVERIYPACPVTELFAELTKTKTLSDNDLAAIVKLGYEIKVQHERVQYV